MTKQINLTRNQVDFFDRFMLAGTRKVLDGFESIFGLEIDSSDSSVEIATAAASRKIGEIGAGPLYAISSEMQGELQGNLHLLLRSGDFKYLGEVMKPLLGLLYLSDDGSDLVTLDKRKPDWMLDADEQEKSDAAFHGRMMDKLTEMANVLFSLYTEAIYMIYDLHTYHSLTESLADPGQHTIQHVLASAESEDQLHLVIENDFIVQGKPIRFWCLISPTMNSFQEILDRIG